MLASSARGLLRRANIGQAIIEFALILPVVTLLVLMGLDFARVMHDRLILLDAARAGAQTAAALPAPPYSDVAAAVVGEAPDMPIQGDTGHVQVSYPGDGTAQVLVSYGFQAITPLIAQTWGGGSLTIRATASWPLVPARIVPTPLPTPSAQPTSTPTAIPTSTPTSTPIASATASAVASATPSRTATPTVTAAPTAPATPTPQPGCTYSVDQTLNAGQGYDVVISTPVGTTAITVSYKAPGTKGAVQVYLYSGGSAFAGDPNPPLTLPPPSGSIASAVASGDTATLAANVISGMSVYTAYFYTTADVTAQGGSARQTIGCSG